MSDNEQPLDTNARQTSTPPLESATWGNTFLAIQKSLAETATLLTELRTERTSKGRGSRGPTTAASGGTTARFRGSTHTCFRGSTHAHFRGSH